MSEVPKKKSPEKKINKSNLKNNNNDTKSNMITNKKDNNSSSVKTKKLVQNSLQMNKSKLKKRNDNDIPFKFVFKSGKFLSEPKILKHFLTFFNIRELFIIMELDTHIFQEVIDSEVFKKYLLIRNDFVKKNINDSDKKNKSKNLHNNDNDKISTLMILGKKEKEDNDKNDKNDKNEKENKKLEFKLPNIDFQKLKLKYLINNNCQTIKKYIKTYSLSNIESRCIFNGIIEYLIIKEKGLPMENQDSKNFSLSNTRILTGLNYFIDSLTNLNYHNLIKLDLSNIGISSINTMKKLCNIFQRYSNTLKILSLAHNEIDDKNAKILFSGLKNNNVIEILNLSFNEIGEEGLENNFLNANTSLHTLSFQHNLLGPIGTKYLFDYLIDNKYMNIKSLDIGYNGITKEGVEYISKYIKNNENIITFNIEGNYLCNEGIKIICESVSQKKGKNYISYLDFQNNNITKKGCSCISNMLLESPFINGILLKNNSLENDGVNKIISTICNENSNLISLDLSDTKIDEKALKIISEKINNNIVLQNLNLSYNNFKIAGNYINNLLTKESNMKYLDLSFCNINNQFNIIFQGLSENKNLKLINLSGNNIPMKKETLNELGKVLINNINLRNLYLNECNIDDIGMNYINTNLENNHSLLTLSLNHNFITKKSITGLENAINKSKIIKNIYLYENKELNINLINQIQNALKNNNNIYITNEEDIKEE